jgi:hypothetical protein
VSLGSSSAAVIVQPTVVIPANATSAAFTANVSSVLSTQTATLTATEASVSKSFGLLLNASIPMLTISSTNVLFGNVTFNTSSMQPVTLTSTGNAAVVVKSVLLSGTGFTMSGATFPITLGAGLAVTLDVQFDPTVAGTAAGA